MKKVRSLGRHLLYSLAPLLPFRFKHLIYRSTLVHIPQSIPENIKFELAKSKEDLESAFKLLHDCYVEKKFIEAKPSGLYLAIQHLLPTTSILVAKIDNKVIGTISLIRDNPLGLPMEKCFDLRKLRKNGQRLAEYSSLAIDPKYRRDCGGFIFYPLLVFAHKYSQQYFGADYAVMDIYPKHRDFYSCIFGCKIVDQLDGKNVKQYLNAPAIALSLNFKENVNFSKKMYANSPLNVNLFHFAYETCSPNFIFPNHELGEINDPVMKPEYLNYFITIDQKLAQSIDTKSWRLLRSVYLNHFYHEKLDTLLKDLISVPVLPRFETKLKAYIQNLEHTEQWEILVLDISAEGFRALVPDHIDSVSMKIVSALIITNVNYFEIEAQAVWRNTENIFGFKFTKHDSTWSQYINELETKQLSKLVA